MKVFNWQLRAVLFAVMAVLGAVCVSYGAGDNPSVLVGHWVHFKGPTNGLPENIELFRDGTGVLDGMSVTWKAENKRLRMLSPFGGVTANYNVTGYELVLVFDNDESATFVKKEKRAEAELRETERAKKEAEQKHEKISGYFTDTRNGQKYRTVKIGGKSWMAENLNYQTGTSWCYENDESKCKQYGRLYDWNTAKTACPGGWHLPSREEWNTMVAAAGNDADYKLKSTSGWALTKYTNANGTDAFGFSALPGGFRHRDGDFGAAGESGYWWPATEIVGAYTYDRHIVYGHIKVGEGDDFKSDGGKSSGFSVRCVAD